MQIPVFYSGNTISLDLPDSWQVDIFESPEKRLLQLDDDSILQTVEFTSFCQKLQDVDKLLIVVNDQYRPTPTAKILEYLKDVLSPEKITFLVASGLHPKPTEVELTRVFGRFLKEYANRIYIHSAYDEEMLTTFSNNESSVKFNKLLLEHQTIMTISSVEPHYFAGYTGGRKIFIPGCVSFEDVRYNHGLALSEQSKPLTSKGNPVWEDIKKRTVFLDDKELLSIQLVTSHDGSIFFINSGNLDETFEKAAEFVVGNYSHQCENLYDLVISVVYPPLDRNLYQLQKSYENMAAVVRDGGTILLVSCCCDGIGDDRFVKLAQKLTSGENFNTESEAEMMGIHKIRRTERLAQRLDLILYSTLEAETLTDLYIKPTSNIKKTIGELTDRYGTDCRTALVHDSASQVLYN